MPNKKNKKVDEYVRNPYKESAYGYYHNAMIHISRICCTSMEAQEKVEIIMQTILHAKMDIACSSNKINESLGIKNTEYMTDVV